MAASVALLGLPMAGLALLLARPELDLHWQHNPSHFWLVLVAAALNAVLAIVTGDAARRRGDARVFFVSLAFLATAGFLGLHALATPGVLLAGSNTGFAAATPAGLLVASVFAAASALPLGGLRAARVLRAARPLEGALLVLMAAWAVVSLAGLPPLDDPISSEDLWRPLAAPAVAAVVLYGVAAARYLRLYRERRSLLVLGVLVAWLLLAEAMVAVALSRSWHASWWEWHLLMLVAFAAVALAARREWHEERFSDLYLEETARSERDVSVLFADLEGFTAFSEAHPGEVAEMLDRYFEQTVPLVVRDHGAEVDKLAGDAIMLRFNLRGDQRDHALRAASAGLSLQRAAEVVASEHPGWPRFRVGVNSGVATVGLLGARTGKREYGIVGDTVNLASRLEGMAAAGQVVIGGETYRRLPDGTTVEPLGGLHVKGKTAPVEAYVLRGLPAGAGEPGERSRR